MCKEFLLYDVYCSAHFIWILFCILQIERTEVDTFKKGKRIPSCQLIAECETEQPTTLKHLVILSGAKDPHNTFTIYRQCDSGTLYNNIMYEVMRRLYFHKVVVSRIDIWRAGTFDTEYATYVLACDSTSL